MLVKYNLTNLWNSEYPLVVRRIIKIVDAHKPYTIHLGTSFDRLAAFRPQVLKIEAQERSDKESALLSMYDRQRDTSFNVIHAVAKAFQRAPREGMSLKATIVVEFLKKHGRNISETNYTAETKRLYDLVHDARRQPDVMAALMAMSLNPVFDDMHETNKKFDKLFMQRVHRRAETEKIDARAIRTECDKAVKLLWKSIEFCCNEYGKEIYTPLINELNVLNIYYKQGIAARTKSRKTKNHKIEAIKPMEEME